MKNKILILYPYSNHDNMVRSMLKTLRQNEINIDALNTSTFRFVEKNLISVSLRTKMILFLCTLPIPHIQGIINRLFNIKNEIERIADKYEIIDFHVFNRDIDSIAERSIGKKIIKITIWGSDFYRADISRREEQRRIYNKCNCIQLATETMKNDFIEYYHDFENKIRVANFGLFMFDVIDNVEINHFKPKFKKKHFSDRLLVVCGYNGSQYQRHNLIIDAIASLDKSIKEKMCLIFPMTYGADKQYIKSIVAELKKLHIPFSVLDNDLTNNEIAKLRLESDLVLNIQTSDAFSGSLQEHLYAGSLLLVGDWLPYKILDEKNVFYKKCTLENFKEQIAECVVNFNYYKRQTEGNKEKMYNLSSWFVAGERMSEIYRDLKR